MKSTILIIDDTSENLKVLVGLLSSEGYDVRAATDGAFGLESAFSAPPDLILLDIKMPGIDGYEVCRRLKSNQITRDIPIIFISALDSVDDDARPPCLCYHRQRYGREHVRRDPECGLADSRI